MSFPAVILCDPDASTLCVAGLPVLDRLAVAAHRAGAKTLTIVSEKPLPRLKRSTALGITITQVGGCPKLTGPTLVLSNRLLVQSADLKRLVARAGRLLRHDGIPLPAGVLTELSGSTPDDRWAGRPAVIAEGVAESVTDEISGAAAGRALWASLGSSADGMIDRYFNRPAGRPLSKILAHTPVSPNQVSVAAILLGLAAAGLFARGDDRAALGGAVLFQVSAIVDCVDGDLARVLFKESAWGQWLDIVGDQVVHIGVFVGIGIGLYRAGSEDPVLPLAASAAIGAMISFAVVLRGRRQAENRRSTRLQQLIAAATNRDFSVLLIVLAALGKLSWFLWMAAIGVHLFWLLVLAACRTSE
jgi:phosphatidylglycerophosphate synthase